MQSKPQQATESTLFFVNRMTSALELFDINGFFELWDSFEKESEALYPYFEKPSKEDCEFLISYCVQLMTVFLMAYRVEKFLVEQGLLDPSQAETLDGLKNKINTCLTDGYELCKIRSKEGDIIDHELLRHDRQMLEKCRDIVVTTAEKI